MKRTIYLGLLGLLVTSCANPNSQETSDQRILNDTIQTASGLKYVLLKAGSGAKIDTGSKVKAFTELYINDADTVFWTTAEAHDSSFNFIHGKTSLIKGFSELNSYLREGDEVIAILPDSLAYGKEGRGTVPPAATLIYSPYVVRYVSAPKESMVDTLMALNTYEDLQTAMEFYREARHGAPQDVYHTEVEDIMDLLGRIQSVGDNAAVLAWADYLSTETEIEQDLEYLDYFRVSTWQAQGEWELAINKAEEWTKRSSSPDFWKETLEALKDSAKAIEL